MRIGLAIDTVQDYVSIFIDLMGGGHQEKKGSLGKVGGGVEYEVRVQLGEDEYMMQSTFSCTPASSL